MAGFDPSVLMTGQPTLYSASTAGSGMGGRTDDGAASAHMGLVSLVLVAVLGLLLLDKAGFKFAVSVGKR
ncbi:unannotated protein [freshwater metagenome]|uniref:Unannotated protein n=1 Tax=freshwater metagenome TaxID=449393 RepID=A0A6J5ZBM2_9ZZZZ|nr:hypothetical protein [Actinomycetota bacterium]